MGPSLTKPDDLDLDLPALDDEGDSVLTDVADDELDVVEVEGDAFDDVTGEGSPHDEIAVEGAEVGWLVDAENAGTLDVGPFDVGLEPEGKILVDDEADTRSGLEDLVSADETFVADGGEEGPLADDEELREEDLPALDADAEGDVPDESLYDRAMLASDEELRWADRAWARQQDLGARPSSDEVEDSGVLVAPSEDLTQTARDAAWKRLDATGRVMAAGFVPGDSVILAVAAPDRSRALLVRIQPDGEARIIAEVDPRLTVPEDDGEACLVTFVRWEASRGCLLVGGNFGVEAYRPA